MRRRERCLGASFTSQTVDLADGVNQHAQVIQNFVDALTKGSSLLTPAKEGLGSLQLANGMLLSQWDDQAVALPIDCQHYEQLLSERIASVPCVKRRISRSKLIWRNHTDEQLSRSNKRGRSRLAASAMTLGGGSAITSLSIGAMFGYEYLWVQPVAMIIGCIMLFALAHQTLSTGERPFTAMRDHFLTLYRVAVGHRGTRVELIWGFSHYPLSAGMLEESIDVVSGFNLSGEGQTVLERAIYSRLRF